MTGTALEAKNTSFLVCKGVKCGLINCECSFNRLNQSAVSDAVKACQIFLDYDWCDSSQTALAFIVISDYFLGYGILRYLPTQRPPT